MEFDLKALFGDKESMTLDELTKATAGAKFVDLKDDGYVEKHKFLKEQTKASDAKTALETATAEITTLKSAADSDDGPSAKLAEFEAKLAEEKAAREATEAKLLNKERESLVADKIASPKLRRLLLQDAEALMADDDDLTFEDAVAKAIETDADYAPSDDDDAGTSAPTRLRTGDETRGKAPKVEDNIAAIDAAFPEPVAKDAK